MIVIPRKRSQSCAFFNTTNTFATMFFCHVSGSWNLLPKFMPISFFGRASRFWGVSEHLALQHGNPNASWNATLSFLFMASKLFKFVSRSDLVLISFGSWPFLGIFGLVVSYLILQACISIRVSDRNGALLFLPCSHKDAVVHVLSWSWSNSFFGTSPASDAKMAPNTTSSEYLLVTAMAFGCPQKACAARVSATSCEVWSWQFSRTSSCPFS